MSGPRWVLLGVAGFLIFGLLGLIDQDTQFLWWLLAAASVVGVMGAVAE